MINGGGNFKTPRKLAANIGIVFEKKAQKVRSCRECDSDVCLIEQRKKKNLLLSIILVGS